jgi:hypothetical protein
MQEVSYKIASFCMLVFSSIFMVWTFRLGKEGKLPLIKFSSMLIVGVFLVIFPGGSLFFIGMMVVFLSLILIFYEFALIIIKKGNDD